MIYVCDAIMGSGKSTAIINYMNSHPEGRYLYISPYLDEAKRIKDNCPTLHFVEPRNDLEEYGNRKLVHAEMLMKQGKNVSSTHQAYMGITKQFLQSVKDLGYTLIIDESLDLLRSMTTNPQDMEIAKDAGLITTRGGELLLTDRARAYGAVGMFSDMIGRIKKRSMYTYAGAEGMFWLLSPELLTAFDTVYIMTYMFDGQDMSYYMQANHIPYEKIGVRKRDGKYEFCDWPGELPEYTKHLGDMIHICDNEKLNQIGEKRTALSATKYKTGQVDMKLLKRNLSNWFRNIMGEYGVEYRLWTTYKDYQEELAGKGYKNCVIECNARATNKYGNKKVLAYLVNIFMNVPNKRFYESRGVTVDENKYSLSILVQWIWRSAIRNGEEIWIYIPSRRMRMLLIQWIKSFSGGDAKQ